MNTKSKPDPDGTETTLIRTIPAGRRREMRVYAVTGARGHSVKIQAFVDDDETGMKSIGQFFVFRRELAAVIEGLITAKAMLDALPPPADFAPQPHDKHRRRPTRAMVETLDAS